MESRTSAHARNALRIRRRPNRVNLPGMACPFPRATTLNRLPCGATHGLQKFGEERTSHAKNSAKRVSRFIALKRTARFAGPRHRVPRSGRREATPPPRGNRITGSNRRRSVHPRNLENASLPPDSEERLPQLGTKNAKPPRNRLFAVFVQNKKSAGSCSTNRLLETFFACLCTENAPKKPNLQFILTIAPFLQPKKSLEAESLAFRDIANRKANKNGLGFIPPRLIASIQDHL